MSSEIGEAANVLSSPGQVIEVRAIMDEGIASGYFDDVEQLADQVDTLDGLSGVQGIYVTLNEVNPALLSRRANRIKARLAKKDATTADSDIIRRRWFPIDVDPRRPSGVSSTDKEHQAAIDMAARISDYLANLGWPAPLLADSGNGAHLLYRIDLPNDEQSHGLVKQGLAVLAALFDDGVTVIDTANHNAARIWKLYGTMSRKGDHTPKRPHRRSGLISVPATVEVVPRELLMGLAVALPAASPDPIPQRSKGASTSLDLAGWLRDHGIGVAREKPYEGGTLYVLDQCPFSGAHRDGAFAIQFPNGAIHAGCQHASCGGGSQRWPELRKVYEKTTLEQRPGPDLFRKTPDGDRNEQQKKALDILQHGDPLRFMLQTFGLDHEGDDVLAECLILSLASRSVLNTNGLHVSVTGESGKGKSHAFSTLLQQVPERFRLQGRMSNKALFYIEGMQPGTVIILDDTSLSDDMQEILKGVTTSFREPFLYRTVSKDRKGVLYTIPERCVWWVAKVEGNGDDQVLNRMLTCWIDDSEEQDARVLARILARDVNLPDHLEEERQELLVCREIWELLGQQQFYVVIPFAKRIRFQAAANRRNPEMLLDLIKTNTVLRFLQREKQRSETVPYLTATREDFQEATRLYGLLNGTAGGQQTKLTKRESDLIAIILKYGWPEFTIPELQKVTGLSSGNIHKCIHGYASRGISYSGLLEKCPAIAYCDRTVVTDERDGGLSMRRRTNAYTFDYKMFQNWCSGGAVWLDDDDDPDIPSTISADFRDTSTAAEVIETSLNGPDLPNTYNNKNKLLCTGDHFHRSQDTKQPENGGVHTSACVCDREVVEVQNPISLHSPQITKIEVKNSPLPLPQVQRSAEGNTGSAEVQDNPPLRINARDYKPLDVPDQVPCHVCGSSWTYYIEMLTEERKRRPKDQMKAYQVCKRCYTAAKRKVQESAMILPGTYDLAGLERLKASVGRCTICDLDSAVYIDRSSGTKFCEVCYRRLSRMPGHGEVSG